METSASAGPTISMSVVNEGIDYGGKKTCHARKNEYIKWESGCPFAIEFRDDSPLEGTSYQSYLVGVKYKLEQRVVNGPEDTELLYSCALYSGGRVYLDARCPIIIVDP